MYELGYAYSRIAEMLNERGYRNKYNQEFTKNSFISILRQEKYMGKYVWNRTKTQRTSNGKRHVEKTDDEKIILDNGCPAIISKEQFDRVQAMLDGSSGVKKNYSKRHYMLSGMKIIKCAECGSYMVGKYVESHGRGYSVYSCPQHKAKKCSMKDIRTECLDNVVADVLAEELSSSEDLATISAIMNGDKEYDKAKNKLDGLYKATNNVMNAIAKGCPSEFAVDKLKSLHMERESLRDTILKHQSSTITITPENIAIYTNNFKNLLKTSDDPEVRLYLKDRIKSITVGKESVSFDIA